MKSTKWLKTKRIGEVGSYWLYSVASTGGQEAIAWIPKDAQKDESRKTLVEWDPSPDGKKRVESFTFHQLPLNMQLSLIVEDLANHLDDEVCKDPRTMVSMAADLFLEEPSPERYSDLIYSLRHGGPTVDAKYHTRLFAYAKNVYGNTKAFLAFLERIDPLPVTSASGDVGCTPAPATEDQVTNTSKEASPEVPP